MTPPRKFSALPALDSYEASPKAISRRTSYLRVRLEFLPYPHLIATLFNGLHILTSRPIKTCSRFGSGPSVLNLASIRNSPDRSTKSTRSRLNALPQLVNTGFQVLFHSPPGVLFTFPSQYFALSVTKEYLALGGGPPDFTQGSTCLALLWIPLAAFQFSGTRLSLSLAGLPSPFP